jgi:hypothetical protein
VSVVSLEQLDVLINGEPEVKQAQHRVRVGRVDSGAFDSKTGSPKRSRKGRTYRAPNGYAVFVPNWDELRSRRYWG